MQKHIHACKQAIWGGKIGLVTSELVALYARGFRARSRLKGTRPSGLLPSAIHAGSGLLLGLPSSQLDCSKREGHPQVLKQWKTRQKPQLIEITQPNPHVPDQHTQFFLGLPSDPLLLFYLSLASAWRSDKKSCTLCSGRDRRNLKASGEQNLKRVFGSV